jgi:hypothetical protein
MSGAWRAWIGSWFRSRRAVRVEAGVAVPALSDRTLLDVPRVVSAHLVRIWHHPRSEAGSLRCLLRTFAGSVVSQIRVVNPAEIESSGLVVTAYDDLADHPELVWYEGWFTLEPRVQLRRISAPAPRPGAGGPFLRPRPPAQSS